MLPVCAWQFCFLNCLITMQFFLRGFSVFSPGFLRAKWRKGVAILQTVHGRNDMALYINSSKPATALRRHTTIASCSTYRQARPGLWVKGQASPSPAGAGYPSGRLRSRRRRVGVFRVEARCGVVALLIAGRLHVRFICMCCVSNSILH